MLFNSYIFVAAFLPATLAGFWLAGRIGHQAATVWLFAASLVFYGWWDVRYLPLLVGSIAVNFLVGRVLLDRRSLGWLWFGIAFNLSLLGYLKYANFFVEGVAAATGVDWNIGRVVLPLGISFFTFQQIAYLVDARRREAVRHGFWEYALFIAFFPQLIAGPIVHQREMLPQYLGRPPRLRDWDLAIGTAIFAIGLFKKVIIADGIAVYATPVFDAAALGRPITFLEAWTGALAYTFQVYFDFSGYSDMAIGLARLFGIRLPVNFASPYKATSIIEFWRRWHMTLSRFLRDYLYVPLGGNRRGSGRRHINIAVVMLLGGLWHGAAWTFVAWGALHGAFLIANHLWRGLASRLVPGRPLAAGTALGRAAAWTSTFLAVVVAWVFFRAESFDSAANILQGMAGLDGRLVVPSSYAAALGPLAAAVPALGGRFGDLDPGAVYSGLSTLVPLALLLVATLVLPNTQQVFRRVRPVLERVPVPAGPASLVVFRPGLAWAGGLGLAAAAGLVGMTGRSEFLYFQF